MREMTFINAIREAIEQEMRRDDSVFVVGQDIRGGVYPHTLGLIDEFGPDRIVDTPIAETAMHGVAFGSALLGYRPIVDFMFASTSMTAFTETAVMSGQQYFLHGSKQPVPLVMTGAWGIGKRTANDHAMPIHGYYSRAPGLKVCMPSTPHDAKGLFTAAIRDNNPVMIPWCTGIMMLKGDVPEEPYEIPIDKASVKQEGSDVTVLANSEQLQFALKVAIKLAGEISVEVIDPISFAPIDMETILTSLEKTNRLVVVDEDWESGGFASTVSARVMEQGFDLLDAPVTRVTFPNMPIPGGYMEDYLRPNPEKIEAAIRAVCA
ncbi:MAG: transketolase [Thiotrichales bacterium SG8_50]|nr:MAG: transketolase [Thiotrichales bacterium SG8_50]